MIFRAALNLMLVVVSAAGATRASAAVDVARAAYDAGRYTEAHSLLDKEANSGSTKW